MSDLVEAKGLEQNPSFCSLLWKHVCVRPNFTLVPCCRFRSQTGSHFSTDVNSRLDMNSGELQQIRQKMLAGERVKGCEECYDEEALTSESLRKSFNRRFGSSFSLDVQVSPELIEYLEVFVGSRCNLKCMGCSPILSSSIREEYEENNWKMPFIYEPPVDANIEFLEQFVNLKHVKFVGGEPLLNKSHDHIIALLRKRDMREMILNYYTNCTIWPNPETLAGWKNVKQVDLTMSIDGVGPRNDYLRFNSKWEKVDKVAKKYFALADEYQNITLQVNVTVSQFNALYLGEIEEWFARIANEYPWVDARPVYMTYLTDPESMATHNCSQELRDKIYEKCMSSGSVQQQKIAKLLHTITCPAVDRGTESFLVRATRLDQVRKTSFRDVFPELGAFYGN